mgnify:CR=1 FL=1
MSILADSVTGYLEHASWIRRMFEAGGQLKARYGADKVYDFSLGNPDLPAPPAVAEGLTAFAQHAREPFAFGYMPNGGYPWAREKLAAHLSQGTHMALAGQVQRFARLLPAGDAQQFGAQQIDAFVPLAEMFGYSTVIRSLTQGKAEFTMEFEKYSKVPTSISDQLKEDYLEKRRKEHQK